MEDKKYIWTSHARMKMRHYRLTEARIKRIIRHPVRVEEGIFPGAIACMSPADGRQYSEIWTFYMLVSSGAWGDSITGTGNVPSTSGNIGSGTKGRGDTGEGIVPSTSRNIGSGTEKKIKVISAWRYPGKSPARDPIPPDVLREIKSLL